MPLVRFDNEPTTSDTVLIEITIKDMSGNLIDPYKVNKVIVYFLDRGIASSPSYYGFTEVDDISGGEVDVSFSNATPVKIYGNDAEPAWLSSDTTNATIQHVILNPNGITQYGVFQMEWNPEFNREGDYFVCWTWTEIIGGSTTSAFTHFFLNSDIKSPAVLPQNATIPGKYEMLMNRYLPSMFKESIADNDTTVDVITRFNNSIAASFTDTENKANQILGLQDANALHESLLPYLSNMFNWKLKTNDSTLWRRQIKRAVPLYKQKGTYKALKEALAESGINLNKITKYWQVMSKSTWQEAFRVDFDNQDSFILEKVPLTYDSLNFELKLMPSTSTTYTTLDITYVSFTILDGIAYMDWIGPFQLNKDDILKVIYKINSVLDQTIEDYIRSLSLADNRSESVMRDNNICYPKKNWNVRIIADDDVMLPIICPTRHPFHTPVVFGKIRTEFPYSENIYNMDEYNGSVRDSINPCDIDKDFVDSCPCCMSSKISVDVELKNLSNDRMVECQDVLREFLPFHTVVHSINFDGAIEEFMLPPVEEIQTYINNEYTDNVINGQMVLNRTIQPWTANMKREMLATANNLVTDMNGKGYNLAYSLYYPAEIFDQYTMGLDMADNQLEILSGLNTGVYSLTNPNGHLIDFDDPNIIPNPSNKTQFPFRLSNKVYEGTGSIFQDNLTIFTDTNIVFAKYNMKFAKDLVTPWQIVVTSGPHSGSYDIYNILPDGSLIILGWIGSSTVTNLNYQLKDDSANEQDSSTTGKLTVQYRGRFETTDNLVQEYLIESNFYLSYMGNQYKISSFIDDSKCYLDGYNGGTVVGTSSIKIFKRIVDNGIGYICPRGMKLTTASNYYNTLQVSDQLEDDQHIENFIVLIGTDYYQIGSWSNTPNGDSRYEITLNGLPLIEWGTVGTTNIGFSIIQFLKTSPVTVTTTFPQIINTTFDRIDRRGNEIISNTTDTSGGMSAAMAATLLNAANSGQPIDLVTHGENISIQIEYLE